jgi:hypothetical protein
LASEPAKFEVHTTRTGSWTVAQVCDSKQAAVDSARHLGSEGGNKAVKVIQAVYDEEEGVFSDKEVFYAGKKFKAKKPEEPNSVLPVCRTASDLYGVEARHSIYNLLEVSLENWGITVVELVYSEENLRRLSDTGTILQAAVQRAAIQQIRDTGQEVQERVLEIYQLVSDARAALKDERETLKFPAIDSDDLSPVMAAVADKSLKARALNIAICRYFTTIEKRPDKLKRLFQFLRANKDMKIIAVLDVHIADHLALPGTMKDLLGASANLGSAILKMITFMESGLPEGTITDDDVSFFENYLVAGRLPRCVDAIISKIKDSLLGSAAFDPDDKFENLLFHGRIKDALRPESAPPVGDDTMIDALANRCERALGSHTIMKVLENATTPWDKIDKLLEVSRGVVGKANMRVIGNHIQPILDSPANETEFVKGKAEYGKRLEQLRKLQAKVIANDFQDFQKEKMARKLDQLSVRILIEDKVIKDLTSQQPDIVSKLQAVLLFLIKDVLCVGESKKMVHKEVKTLMSDSGFTQAIEKLASGPGEHKTLLTAFHQLLGKAGYQ